MQNDGEDGEQPIDVGLRIQKSITLEAVGFQKKCSIADHLVHFDSYIRNAFAKTEHSIVIFFDLVKTYDTTWKHSLPSDLYDLDF